MVRGGDGAAGHHSGRSGAEWHTKTNRNPLHQYLRPERRQIVLRLQLQLLHRPPGGAQSAGVAHAAEQSSAAVVARISSRRDLPLSADRPQLQPQRAEGGAGLVCCPPDQGCTRHHRCRHFWWNHAAVSGRDRSQSPAGHGHEHDAGGQCHPEQQCQRRRQLPDDGQSKRERPRHRAAEVTERYEQHRRSGA